MSKQVISLSDLERFELVQAMFPDELIHEHDFGDEEEVIFEKFGVDAESFDLIAAHLVMLSAPMRSPLTGTASHVLGKVEILNDQVHMTAAVKREVEAQS